ncbi:MAG: hypothetical protein ACON5H_00845 [Akkermansiaceae bacterium]
MSRVVKEESGIYHLSPEIKSLVLKNVLFYVKAHWPFLAGLVVAIGSSGLLLGGCTVLLTYILMGVGMEMIPAMIIGFFTVGIAGAVLGTLALVKGFHALMS